MNNISLERAAEILEKSKNVLFLTGAGMSADSGIPTFSDKEGFWKNFPVYKKTGLNPICLADGKFFRNNPEISWGFYEWRRRNARMNAPHEGYSIVNDIVKNKEGFVVTTNTDGYHLRSGISENQILEIHGSMWRLQFLDGSGNYVKKNHQVPLCELNEKTMGVAPESIPQRDGKILRPNVMMFSDSYYVRNDYQKENFQNFQERCIGAVFLIGSGKNVRRNINLARFYQQRGSKVICLNPLQNECYPILNPDVSLEMKAEEGLTELRRALNGS